MVVFLIIGRFARLKNPEWHCEVLRADYSSDFQEKKFKTDELTDCIRFYKLLLSKF